MELYGNIQHSRWCVRGLIKKFHCLSRCTSSLPISNRPKKWNDDATGRSYLEAEGKIGINRAALEFYMPHTTLKDRVSGRVIHERNMGAKMYLTFEEEKELDFLQK